METSNKLGLRLNNDENGIRDNSKGFRVTSDHNRADHSLKNSTYAILKSDFKTTADKLLCEQACIHLLKIQTKDFTEGLPYLSLNSYYYSW